MTSSKFCSHKLFITSKRHTSLLVTKLKLRLLFVLLGVALTGHINSVHQTRTELDCSHKCLSNPKCASFNFEIQESRSLSICELNNVSRMSSNNKLKRRGSFAYYEPLTPRQRPRQEIAAFCLTTSNLITEAATTEGTQEVGTSQDIAATPAGSVPSAQPATRAEPGKWLPNQRVNIEIVPRGLFLSFSYCFAVAKVFITQHWLLDRLCTKYCFFFRQIVSL